LINGIKSTLALKGNVRIIVILSFLASIGGKMLEVIWQPFVLSLGASMPILGALQSTKSVIASLVQPISGRAADRLGRKPLIILASLLTLVVFVLCIVAQTWYFLILPVVLWGIVALGWPARQSLLAESVEPGERGTAYSVVTFSGTLTGFFAPLVGGLLATDYGFKSVFYVSILMEALCLGLVILFVRETLRTRGPGAIWVGEDVKTTLTSLFRPERGLGGFYAAMTMDAFSVGVFGSICYGMLTQTFRFTPYQLGILSTASAVSMVASQILMGKLVDRYGRKPSLILSGVLVILVVLGWLIATSFETFVILQVLGGIAVSAWGPASWALLADSVPEEGRAEAMGRFTCFKDLISSPAPYVGGILYGLSGFRGPILASLILKVLILLIVFLFVQEGMDHAKT
jgi:DHA1 family multidrug resistance protein-like MFS transporter